MAFVGTKGVPCIIGGFETFVEEIATRLSKMGISCVVYSTSTTNQVSYDPPSNITPRRVPQNKRASARVKGGSEARRATI